MQEETHHRKGTIASPAVSLIINSDPVHLTPLQIFVCEMYNVALTAVSCLITKCEPQQDQQQIYK